MRIKLNGKSVGGNSLSLLLGDYNSDSETEDNENGNSQLNDKLQEFLSDLNTIVTTNWTQCIDKSTGHPYYWNTLTKDVTWDMPAEYEQFLQQNLRSKSSNKENSYTVCYTDENVPYYVNEYTRQVSWERPAGFVEPKAKVKENPTKSKKSSKNTSADRNGHKKKSSKKQAKVTKPYPFDGNDDLDHVKIELISSFTTKSDSSSEEETKSKKAKTNFNLVANDYNSDENSDNESKTATAKPTLFASLTATNSIDPSTVKIYSLKTDLPNLKSSSTDETEPNVADKPSTTKSRTNTFASIITGGRNSPSDQDNELIELMKLEVTEAEPPANQPVPVDKPTEIDVKSFKRKRRIEFMTRPIAPVKQSPAIPRDDSTTVAVTSEAESQNVDASDAYSSTTKPMYSNFVRPGAESSPATANETSADSVPTAADGVVSDELNKQKAEIVELRAIIESKLKFLCNGRPDVSAVQAIFIQFETLLEAYDSQALQPAYMQRWLDGISSDFGTLESDAAPAGWKCLWNRKISNFWSNIGDVSIVRVERTVYFWKKSQYCYKNLTTGDIRWEYPENDDKSEEMDICTTPPPNVDEQLKLEQSQHQKLNCENGDDNSTAKLDEDGLPIPPPPPHISFVDDEPPPRGTDSDRNKEKPSEQINSELASFYSEMATIDTDSMPATEPATSSSTTETAKIPEENASTDALLKKKKKKVKKSEPWRSGNLESWINKWQKAQKELDG